MDAGTHHAASAGVGWAPQSPCSEACLVSEFTPRGRTSQALRVVALGLVVCAATVVLLLLPVRLRPSSTCHIHSGILRALGVRVRISGDLDIRRQALKGVLVVANHLSWIDALALGATGPARILAKREIRGWPLIGLLLRRAGGMFVDRPRLRDLPDTLGQITAALNHGDVVVAFPEGTTFCGGAAGPFHPAIFQTAIDAGAYVQPVAIALRLLDGRRAPAAYVAEGTLWQDVRRVLRIRGLCCELTVLPHMVVDPLTTRRALAAAAQRAVVEVTAIHPQTHHARSAGHT